MNILLAPLQYEFFVHGLIAATIVGGLCGLIGFFVVLRRMSYIGHGLSHAIFGGAIVSYIINLNFYIGATIWAFFSVLLINYISKRFSIAADATIGIITTASFALGVALISYVRHFSRNFDAALFGNILGVTRQDLFVVGIIGIVTSIVIFFTYRQLLFLSFDPEVAQVTGVNVGFIDGIFSSLLAATIIASLQIMGVTLIAAALIIPAIIARLLSDDFNKALGISIITGSLCGLIGMYVSFYVNVASGATIVIISALVFFVILIRQHLGTSTRKISVHVH